MEPCILSLLPPVVTIGLAWGADERVGSGRAIEGGGKCYTTHQQQYHSYGGD